MDVSARGLVARVANSGFLAINSLRICSSDMLFCLKLQWSTELIEGSNLSFMNTIIVFNGIFTLK